jgi:hypothetical protein
MTDYTKLATEPIPESVIDAFGCSPDDTCTFDAHVVLREWRATLAHAVLELVEALEKIAKGSIPTVPHGVYESPSGPVEYVRQPTPSEFARQALKRRDWETVESEVNYRGYAFVRQALARLRQEMEELREAAAYQSGRIAELEPEVASLESENTRLREALTDIVNAKSESFESLAVYVQNVARAAINNTGGGDA